MGDPVIRDSGEDRFISRKAFIQKRCAVAVRAAFGGKPDKILFAELVVNSKTGRAIGERTFDMTIEQAVEAIRNGDFR